MRPACSALIAIAALAACERPATLVICHNANCAEPVDPENDDTLAALEESLALTYEGRPAIDGVEIDSFWRGEDDTCLFAHDLVNAPMTAAIEPANAIAAHLATPGPLTFSGEPFRVMIELKSVTSNDTTSRHTAVQRDLHARCAWDMYAAISNAAVAHDREVSVTFSAFAPELLRALIANAPVAAPTPYRYGVVLGVPAPLDDQTRELGDYAGIPIGLVEVHNQWLTDGQFEAIEGMGAELAFWMFSATVETFAAIDQYEPAVVVASEAQLVRRWLER